MRIALVVVALLAALPATASTADLTPDGPATLMSEWTGPATMEGRPPEVLVAATVTVGAGGRAGSVRIRAKHEGVEQVGDPVDLPAEPGTYTFRAPHIRWDYRFGQLGIDQTTGGHALIERKACEPGLGRFSDPCETTRVNLSPPHETLRGARLTIAGVYETDLDEDLVGDQTEDRTDLRVTFDARRVTRLNGRWRVPVTVTNAGPLTAHRPSLTAGSAHSSIRVEGCLPKPLPWYWGVDCGLAPIAAGASRTVTVVSDERAAADAILRVASEGPDLAPADNGTGFIVDGLAPLALTVPAKQSLRTGVKVRLRGPAAGRARVTLALGKLRVARTVTLRAGRSQTVSIRPTGAKLRALLRRVPGRATITVRPAGGEPVSVKTTLRR